MMMIQSAVIISACVIIISAFFLRHSFSLTIEGIKQLKRKLGNLYLEKQSEISLIRDSFLNTALAMRTLLL